MHFRSAVSCVAAVVGTGASLLEAGFRLPPLAFQSASLPALARTHLTSTWSHEYCPTAAALGPTLVVTKHLPDDADDGGPRCASSQVCFSVSWNASRPLSLASSLTSLSSSAGAAAEADESGDDHTALSRVHPGGPNNNNHHHHHHHHHGLDLLQHFTVTESGDVYITNKSTTARAASQSPFETYARSALDGRGASVLNVNVRINLELQWQWETFQILVGHWLNRIAVAGLGSSSFSVEGEDQAAENLGEIDSALALLFLQRRLELFSQIWETCWSGTGSVVEAAPKILLDLLSRRPVENTTITTITTTAAPPSAETCPATADFLARNITPESEAESEPKKPVLSRPADSPPRPKKTSSVIATLNAWAYDPRVKCSATDTGLVLCLVSLLGISAVMGLLLMPEDDD